MNTGVLWTLLKMYLGPIVKWAFTQAYREKFDLQILKEKAIQNEDALKRKLLQHTITTSELALKKFDEVVKEAESREGYTGTMFDEEMEFGGGSNEKYYNGQNLPKIPFSSNVDDQREFSNIIGNVGCFIYGNTNNARMNLLVEFDEAERKNIAERGVSTKGYTPGWGGYFSEGADQSDELLDSKKVKYQRYRVLTSSTQRVLQVLDAGYSLAMPINISNELRDGLFDDGILTRDEMVGNKRFGHLMNIKKSIDGKYTLWIDNYPKTESKNIFTIEEITALLRSGKFMRLARFYAPLKDIQPKAPEPIEIIEVPAKKEESSSEKAIRILGLKNERLNDPISRFESFSVAGRQLEMTEKLTKVVASIDKRLKKLEK